MRAQETSKSITLIHGTISSNYGTAGEVCLTCSYRPPKWRILTSSGHPKSPLQCTMTRKEGAHSVHLGHEEKFRPYSPPYFLCYLSRKSTRRIFFTGVCLVQEAGFLNFSLDDSVFHITYFSSYFINFWSCAKRARQVHFRYCTGDYLNNYYLEKRVLTWAFWKYKNKESNKFLVFWRHTEHFIFNDKQISVLQSDLQTAQLPGSDSGGSLLSQLNQSDCFRSSHNPQETCISNEPQHKPRAPKEAEASQTRKRKNFSWPFPGIAVGKHCRKGSRYFQMEKPLMRTESGPRTRTDQNQTEWHRSRRLIAASEKPARLHHEIRNTWSISEPLGDSKPFQATDERKKKETSTEGTVWRSLHHVLALRWTQRTSERDTNTRTGYSAAPQGPACGSWGWGSQEKLCPCAGNTLRARTEARDRS